MIAYSDNDAATLINSRMLTRRFYNRYFRDLKVPEPPGSNGEYFINVSEMSKFFRVIYNSHYLGPRWSELCARADDALRLPAKD